MNRLTTNLRYSCIPPSEVLTDLLPRPRHPPYHLLPPLLHPSLPSNPRNPRPHPPLRHRRRHRHSNRNPHKLPPPPTRLAIDYNNFYYNHNNHNTTSPNNNNNFFPTPTLLPPPHPRNPYPPIPRTQTPSNMVHSKTRRRNSLGDMDSQRQRHERSK